MITAGGTDVVGVICFLEFTLDVFVIAGIFFDFVAGTFLIVGGSGGGIPPLPTPLLAKFDNDLAVIEEVNGTAGTFVGCCENIFGCNVSMTFRSCGLIVLSIEIAIRIVGCSLSNTQSRRAT